MRKIYKRCIANIKGYEENESKHSINEMGQGDTCGPNEIQYKNTSERQIARIINRCKWIEVDQEQM